MEPNQHHLVITGGEGDLARAIVSEFEHPHWVIDAPGRSQLDVSCRESIRAFFQGRNVDLWIGNAGKLRDAPIARLQPDAWQEVWQVNYQGALDCAREVLPHMVSRGAGHLVFISSYSALHPPLGQSAYATAKAALLGLVADLAREYGPCGIRVNAILPGFLETRMSSGISRRRRAEILSDHVLGRFNTTQHVARFIRHLHQDLPHTSGQCFQLDSRPPPP